MADAREYLPDDPSRHQVHEILIRSLLRANQTLGALARRRVRYLGGSRVDGSHPATIAENRNPVPDTSYLIDSVSNVDDSDSLRPELLDEGE